MLDRAWVDAPLAAIVLAVAAYCTGRLAAAPLRGRRIEYDVDMTHVVMGVSMAGMLVSALSFADTTVWVAVFTLVAAWYTLRTIGSTLRRPDRWRRLRHHAGHLLPTAAMLYMYLAPAGAPNGMDMGISTPLFTSGTSAETHQLTLAPIIAVLLFTHAILVAGRIPATAAPSGHRGESDIDIGTLRLAPRAAATCDAVMSLAMGIVLIIGLSSPPR